MANRTEYKITGSSKTRPVGLPEGFEVKETKVDVVEVIDTNLSRRITITESGMEGAAHIKLEDTGQLGSSVVQAFLSPNVTRKLRNTLTEIIGDGKTNLRVIHDGSDPASGEWRWFEIEPDKFDYYHMHDAIPEKVQEGRIHYKNYDYIVTTYGTPRSVNFR